jgi:hypothetical protein
MKNFELISFASADELAARGCKISHLTKIGNRVTYISS